MVLFLFASSTFAPDDTVDVKFYFFATGQTFAEKPAATLRMSILSRSPGAAALQFRDVIRAFEKYVVGWDVKARKPYR